MSSMDNAELRRFTAFRPLPEAQIEAILDQFPLRSAPAGTQLVTMGSSDINDLYLVSGIVRVTNRNGEETFIDDRSPLATEPLAKKSPREYDIRAASDVDYMLLPPNLHRLDLTSTEEIDMGRPIKKQSKKVTLQHRPARVPIKELLAAIDNDLKLNQLSLPSAPELSLPIQRYMDNCALDKEELAELLLIEPCASFKFILKAKEIHRQNEQAQSKTTRGIQSLERALEVVPYEDIAALMKHHHEHEQFSTEHQLIRKKSIKAVKNSMFVALISEALAEQTSNLDAQAAKLAGLLHNIGTFPLLNYIEHSPLFVAVADLDEKRKTSLCREIGLRILTHFHFDQKFLTVIKDGGHWDRDLYAVADYADIVNIARLHSVLDQPEQKHFPAIQDLPATQKIYGGKLSEATSRELVEQAWTRINLLKKKIKHESELSSEA